MEQAGLILLKTNVAIIIFTAFYWLLLRKLTFYNINRLYLLFAVLFSLLYPFIEISNLFSKQLPSIPAMVPRFVSRTESLLSGAWFYLACSIWIVGFLYFLIRLSIQFYSLHRLHRLSAPSETSENIRIVHNEVSPFSFGSYIYINPKMHSEEELNAILLHEHIHVRQKHSVDILVTEFLMLFNWFNPFSWILRKAVKDNIEYITDDQVLKNGVNKKEYQYHLLNTTCLSPDFRVQNNFSISDLRKRISQMNMKRSAAGKLIFYSMIPLLAVFLLLFNQPVKKLTLNLLSPQQQGLSNENEAKESVKIAEGVPLESVIITPLNTAEKQQSSAGINAPGNSTPASTSTPANNTIKIQLEDLAETPPPPPPQEARTNRVYRGVPVATEESKQLQLKLESAMTNKEENAIILQGYPYAVKKSDNENLPANNSTKLEEVIVQGVKRVKGVPLSEKNTTGDDTEVIVIGRKTQQ
ncbi:M56 family metallopeptidase [Gynurincola endophyticus]|uniref:M56 family metallopeptidase n=1 Tax=Gynurincola endophyticus TaxID=2479004 RepID=UPI000F8EE112|nr:M56 family metallopeptidase [Gynurincola endophyticus]